MTARFLRSRDRFHSKNYRDLLAPTLSGIVPSLTHLFDLNDTAFESKYLLF